MIPIGVIVVTRNREPRLRALLESLREQTADEGTFEVVVVDDGSTDGTEALLASQVAMPGLELRTIRVEDRPGLAALRNLGWRESPGRLIAFIDDDCEAESGWLTALMNAGAAHADDIVLQGSTLPIERELEFDGPLWRTKRIETAGPWYQTCNIAYPRDLLERLGGFDETFEVAGEDTDLGWRSIESGARIEFCPNAIVRHAVERIGVDGWLRIAKRERVISTLFRRHPALRAEVATAGIFKDDHKARFALAALGLLLSYRIKPAALLALPYARLVAARCRGSAVGPPWAAWFVAYDAIAFVHSARGAVESRSWLI